MIRITAENIYVLRNSTGKPFTDLLDRLIRSSAATCGIPPSAVLDNPRTNLPDGGVDTQVTTGSRSDPAGYFSVSTTWQYKAIALKEFTDTKVKEEITGLLLRPCGGGRGAKLALPMKTPKTLGSTKKRGDSEPLIVRRSQTH
jgi:hypothetical protein